MPVAPAVSLLYHAEKQQGGRSMSEEIDIDDIPKGERLYSEEDRKIRDKFVMEYLRDHNMYAAGVRMGYTGQNAMDFSKALLNEPYVANKIAELKETGFGMLQLGNDSATSHGVDHKDAISQRIINGLMKEAFDYGPGTKQQARITALNKLADIYKVGEESSTNIKTNVMVVPAMGTVDSWEKAASVQQEQLKHDIRH